MPRTRSHKAGKEKLVMTGSIPEVNFVLYPQLTPVQDRAFQLLDLGVKV
jgi:hypothetical protein